MYSPVVTGFPYGYVVLAVSLELPWILNAIMRMLPAMHHTGFSMLLAVAFGVG